MTRFIVTDKDLNRTGVLPRIMDKVEPGSVNQVALLVTMFNLCAVMVSTGVELVRRYPSHGVHVVLLTMVRAGESKTHSRYIRAGVPGEHRADGSFRHGACHRLLSVGQDAPPPCHELV